MKTEEEVLVVGVVVNLGEVVEEVEILVEGKVLEEMIEVVGTILEVEVAEIDVEVLVVEGVEEAVEEVMVAEIGVEVLVAEISVEEAVEEVLVAGVVLAAKKGVLGVGIIKDLKREGLEKVGTTIGVVQALNQIRKLNLMIKLVDPL